MSNSLKGGVVFAENLACRVRQHELLPSAENDFKSPIMASLHALDLKNLIAILE